MLKKDLRKKIEDGCSAEIATRLINALAHYTTIRTKNDLACEPVENLRTTRSIGRKSIKHLLAVRLDIISELEELPKTIKHDMDQNIYMHRKRTSADLIEHGLDVMIKEIDAGTRDKSERFLLTICAEEEIKEMANSVMSRGAKLNWKEDFRYNADLLNAQAKSIVIKYILPVLSKTN